MACPVKGHKIGHVVQLDGRARLIVCQDCDHVVMTLGVMLDGALHDRHVVMKNKGAPHQPMLAGLVPKPIPG